MKKWKLKVNFQKEDKNKGGCQRAAQNNVDKGKQGGI